MTDEDFINTKFKPQDFDLIHVASLQAMAYYSLLPYPYFAFMDWKKEERGPLPTCMPFVRGITRKGAKWLFGAPLHFEMPDPKIQKVIHNTWKDNRMPSRMVSMAQIAGQTGTIVLKFSYDEEKYPEQPLRFDILNPLDNCRLFFDPNDCLRLAMLRIQYPYFDSSTHKMMWFREEWTSKLKISYEPKEANSTIMRIRQTALDERSIDYGTTWTVAGEEPDPDKNSKWKEIARVDNPFGLIPCQVLYNEESNGQWGIGDLWGLWRTIDRINLSYWLQDKSNQYDSELQAVYIDLEAEPGTLDKPIPPGSSRSFKTDNMAEGADMRQGKVATIEPAGRIRPYIESYAHDLRQMIYDSVGYVEVHQGEVTNKGNLTQAVLAQLYAPLIEVTREKRKTYGDLGVAQFLAKVCRGLKRLGIKDFRRIKENDVESYTPRLQWSDHFELTEAEKLTRVERFISEEQNGLMIHEALVRKVAIMEDLDNVDETVSELKSWKPPTDPATGLPIPTTGTPPSRPAPTAGNLSSKVNKNE